MKFLARTQYRFGGVALPLDLWAKRMGTYESVLKRRLRKGWSVRKTLSTPVSPDEARDKRHFKGVGRIVTNFTSGRETMSIPAWARHLGLDSHTVLDHVKNRRPLLIDGKPRILRRVELYGFRGETLSVAEWASRLGITQKAFRSRVEAGLLDEEIFKPYEKPRPETEDLVKSPYSDDYHKGFAEGMWIVLTLVSTLMTHIPDAATASVVREVRAQLNEEVAAR